MVSRFDPESGRAVGILRLCKEYGMSDLAVGEGAVWVLDDSGLRGNRADPHHALRAKRQRRMGR